MLFRRFVHLRYCLPDGNQEYPVLCPAVIVGITNGDKIILSKYEGRRFKRYALIAGFAEIGETIEETVHREVMEEVGLKVKNLRYYKSQPWSFSGTLLFVLIGQTKEKIKEAAEKHGFHDIILCEDLKEAVKVCEEKAQPGDAVLLSPACASWGQFDNYEQRGRLFKEYVGKLEN